MKLGLLLPRYIVTALNNLIVRRKYDVKIYPGAKVSRGCTFEGGNIIYYDSIIWKSYIGYGTYISNNSRIKLTKIGKYCAIGDYVQTYLGSHPVKEFVSIHPAFFSTKKQAGFSYVAKDIFEEHKFLPGTNKYTVEIGNDVWIGNNVLIMDGTRIGDGAVLAAGSIVVKDVPPYAIIAGVPGKILKYRFDDDTINFLLKFKWWDKDRAWIQENAGLFRSVEELKNKYCTSFSKQD